jgi:hypothetical protein
MLGFLVLRLCSNIIYAPGFPNPPYDLITTIKPAQ